MRLLKAVEKKRVELKLRDAEAEVLACGLLTVTGEHDSAVADRNRGGGVVIVSGRAIVAVEHPIGAKARVNGTVAIQSGDGKKLTSESLVANPLTKTFPETGVRVHFLSLPSEHVRVATLESRL